MRKIIGITGGTATGKTTVSKYIKSLGYQVYDCDEIAHSVFMKSDIQEKLQQAFNIKCSVKREDIAEIVFQDKNKMAILNTIMRPAILKEMEDIIKNSAHTIFFDTPLLYDWHLGAMFDKVVFVYAGKDMQIKRLIARDSIDIAYATDKLNAQLPIDKKLEIAIVRGDIIIDNNSDEKSLYKKVDAILKELSYDI